MSNPASPDLPIYELYAIRYAARDAVRSEHFIGGDPHDGPMPMDYFVWLAKSDDHIVVIDTGFTAEMAIKRKRDFIQCPIQTLADFGIAADAVDDVVLTHLHYDHSGILTGFRMHNSIFKNKSCNLPLAAICAIPNCNMRLNWMMFAALFGLITRKKSPFMTVMVIYRQGCGCIARVAIRQGCNLFRFTPNAAGLFWHRMPAIITNICRIIAPSPLPFMLAR